MGNCSTGSCSGCGSKEHEAAPFVAEGDLAARGELDYAIPHRLEDYKPLLPRRAPPYKVHWNWEIILPCNYRCRYCVVHNESASFLTLPVEEWRKIWGRMFKLYGCCQVRFAGGEPTIYPDFINLVAMILEMHTVDITTNLSFDVEEWIKKVPAQGIAISGSLHLDHVEPGEFLKKLLILRDRGNQLISASLVAYPPTLHRVEPIREMFEEEIGGQDRLPDGGRHGRLGLPWPRRHEQLHARLDSGLRQPLEEPAVSLGDASAQIDFHGSAPQPAAGTTSFFSTPTQCLSHLSSSPTIMLFQQEQAGNSQIFGSS